VAIPVIDLFAGPGGLGEGFSALNCDDKKVFKIGLSIEKDLWAHRTLELRAFFRSFPIGEAPDAYYSYLAHQIDRENLFRQYCDNAARARSEAWHAELGSTATSDRDVDQRMREALGQRQNWVLVGGPPCQAYSLVGRSRVIGERGGRQKYEADPRHNLYKHYLRILAVHRPPVFVMENVKGLLSAKVQQEHIFERILSDLENPTAALPDISNHKVGYRLFPMAARDKDSPHNPSPKDFVVCSERYGIPQARHRVIILGVRDDVCPRPDVLNPADTVTVREVIGDLPRLRSGVSKGEDSPGNWRRAVLALVDEGWMQNGALTRQLRQALKSTISRVGGKMNRGADFVSCSATPKRYVDWFFDARLHGACNHETRAHIRADLHRYFFAAVYAREFGRSPLLEDFPTALLPKHQNVASALKVTKFNDRFRVQLANRPSTTIVSHIAKDGHYYIHYDPSQCRSLSVREAARLQTFPDNYFFEGPRTEQYKQVGNAVPPLLAKQIACIVADVLRKARVYSNSSF
jgi:DNA (cytosine-5)-methyltransferase 1